MCSTKLRYSHKHWFIDEEMDYYLLLETVVYFEKFHLNPIKPQKQSNNSEQISMTCSVLFFLVISLFILYSTFSSFTSFTTEKENSIPKHLTPVVTPTQNKNTYRPVANIFFVIYCKFSGYNFH